MSLELAAKNTGGLWSKAWKRLRFRIGTFLSVFVLLMNWIVLPSFFQFLEQRPGALLDDPVLRILPAKDFSEAIFFLIYLSLLYLIGRSVFSPAVFIRFLTSYALLLLMRVATLYMVPLDPPEGLIPMPDPWTPFFAGAQALTRDLFFSGHTSTAFLVFLSLTGKGEKAVALAVVAMIALLLLFQHIHYTIDVVAAIPFAYLCYRISKKAIP
ncbi:MAG: hypothetical protein H6557_21035 [Lewinellaceae bacterium]|nr:hypothetical protein [Phaeodactylibacter sp.]MCB9039105.1 hypothetical protein [Lewinellaceae bacterium]